MPVQRQEARALQGAHGAGAGAVVQHGFLREALTFEQRDAVTGVELLHPARHDHVHAILMDAAPADRLAGLGHA